MRQLFKLRPGSRPDDGGGDDPIETTPFPPRFRWLQRVAAGYFSLVICLALLYGAWTAYSHHQLAAAIAAIRARGEPIFLADFLPTDSLPDQRNGAIPLKAAGDVIEADPGNGPSDRFPSQYWNDPWTLRSADAKGRREVGLYVTRRAEALRLVRSARAFNEADWGTRLRSEWIKATFPHLAPQRELSSFLTRAAAYRHAVGDDAEAVETARDLLHQSDLLALDTPTGPAISVSREAAMQAVTALDHLAPTLSLPRQRVREVTDQLLDDRLARQRFAIWPRFERAGMLDVFQSTFERNQVWPRPMWRLDTVRAIHRWDDLVAAGPKFSYADIGPATRPFRNEWDDRPRRDEPFWEKFRRPYPPRLGRATHVLSQIEWPNVRAGVIVESLARLGRRVVAVRLAARSYQLDHGRLPRAWDELVPEYLIDVPRDPFAPADQPLHMIEADGLVIVYSVGLNGVDDGGVDNPRASLRYAGDDWQARNALPRAAWDQWGGGWIEQRRDLAYPLQINRSPPTTRSSP